MKCEGNEDKMFKYSSRGTVNHVRRWGWGWGVGGGGLANVCGEILLLLRECMTQGKKAIEKSCSANVY